jgi:hypothetical protein
MQPKVSDYFAELYVAGRFADAGWNVYFPHRDHGFDFIIAKDLPGQGIVIRPVQVKGKYPTEAKGYQQGYGFSGALSQLHPQMVLVIPYFTWESQEIPTCVAYLPRSVIRTTSRGYRSFPARYEGDKPLPRAHYLKFFGAPGLSLLEAPNWSTIDPGE